MADAGGIESYYQAAELRQSEPLRDLFAQDPALRLWPDRPALPGNHKHQGTPIAMSAMEKII